MGKIKDCKECATPIWAGCENCGGGVLPALVQLSQAGAGQPSAVGLLIKAGFTVIKPIKPGREAVQLTLEG